MGNCEMLCDQFESDKNQILITKYKKGKGKGKNYSTQARTIQNQKSDQFIDDSSKDLIFNNVNNSLSLTPKLKEEHQKGISTHLYTPSTLNNSQRELFAHRDMLGLKNDQEINKIIKLQRAYKQRLSKIKEVKVIISQDDIKKYVGFALRFNTDIKHTFGILKWNDGDEYKGTFYNDLLSGYGRYLTNESGTTYEGQFKNNEMNGFGVEKWKLGSVFIGDYVNNEKNGIGLMNFDDYSVFEGEFKENNINGYGTLTQSNIIIKGFYVNNQLDKYGIWEDKKSNRRYEGEMTPQGDWEGFGILYEGDNSITIGKWHQSKLNGEAITIFPNKTIKQDKITIYDSIAKKIIRGGEY